MAALSEKEITSLDLYALLDVSPDSDEKQIVKAYRKKALKCHPDKNPDDPNAADLFHKISRALEVLTDKAAKEAYDKVLRAKKATEIRNRQLNAKRRKLKEDLELREASAFQKQADVAKASRTLAEEIARLRKEGSSLLKQEQDYLREELHKKEVQPPTTREESYQETDPEEVPRLKVKWRALKDDVSNGGYSDEKLLQIFSKYGKVVALIVSSKRKGSAVVEYETSQEALTALTAESDVPSNPLNISWLSGEPRDTAVRQPERPFYQTFPAYSFETQTARAKPTPSSGERDFESLVLMRMRQAEERKRLAAQLAEEDDEQPSSGKMKSQQDSD